MKKGSFNWPKMVILLATIVCSWGAYASKKGVVVVEKAIIYADRDMLAELGFLGRGKEVLVGEVKRARGQLVPIVIGGKIAYIKVRDIRTEDQVEDEKEISSRIRHQLDNLRPNWIELHTAYFTSTFTNGEAIVGEEESKLFNLSGFGVKAYKVGSTAYRTYRILMERLAGENADKEKFIMFNLDVDYIITLLNYSSLNFKIFLGINLVPHAQYGVDDLFIKNGYGGGGQGGAIVDLKFTDQWKVHLQTSYNYRTFTGFSLPEEVDKDFAPTFAGAAVSGGISYAF